MLHRHTAAALLATATVRGGGAQAAAGADAGSSPDRSILRLPLHPRASTVAHEPTASDPPGPQPDSEAAASSAWTGRVAQRLAALAAAARDHAEHRPPEATASGHLQQRLQRIVAGMHDDATLGIAVRELSTGAPVFEWDAERSLNPASNHKLLTAAAALELLGDDYRVETRVLRDGDALVLVGEGDPSLQLHDLAALADAVADTVPLSEIRHIVVDDTAFSSRRFGPGYDPEGPGVSYMAPSGALSLQFNTVEIEVRGAAKGRPARVSVSPPCDHLEIRSTASGGPGALSVHSYDHGDRTVVDVRGHLRKGAVHRKRRRITEPGLFTGSAFAELLAHRGATALTVERGRATTTATLLSTHRSAPLPEVLESALAYSNNFTTEQLLRTLGWRMTGQPGDWDNGHLALTRYWEAAGLPADAVVFENASGLSARGRITAAALTDLLSFATREGSPAAALMQVLPIAGREGTVRDRLRRSGGRVRAKTGTLRGASALSGIVEAKGGRRLGFSILVNGPVSPTLSRRLQDQLVMALVEHGTAG
ncbi:MAG: D-alanyl-D-alanine carboxypeptidase/D-alanyl-D-alanine-endopeptidase [Nannocystaceae bacterium]